MGTHRLLSRDVVPKDLGLVIVDEEQRFGVSQKELMRQLRLEVDVLALSATPIPRTLHMSLAGLRDISVIETPPQGRRPIRTHVGEYDEELVREALLREHRREGQSFFLHNRVETIEEAAEHIRQLVPELRVTVAHGQMPERELEGHMLSFLAGDADVLVSTTIIESGLDIPQANTLIVERADALGLAQLYQIRGRVGRSDEVAHAYLFYPDGQELTPEARARLATLADHTELGSGFAIAMRDLEIEARATSSAPSSRGTWPRSGSSSTSSSSARPSPSSPARAAPLPAPCGSTPRWTRTSRRTTCRPRPRRSTSIAASRSWSPRTSCASSTRRPRIASGRSPSRSRTCSPSRRRSSSSRGSARTTSSSAAGVRSSGRSCSDPPS